MDGHGEGQQKGDWTSDTVPHPHEYECTECHDKIAPDVWIFQKGERLLCGDCIVMVLNAREDYIRDREADRQEEARCPFCDFDDCYLSERDECIVCPACGAKGPTDWKRFGDTELIPLEMWERRANAPREAGAVAPSLHADVGPGE